jgi:hypothetical protein
MVTSLFSIGLVLEFAYRGCRGYHTLNVFSPVFQYVQVAQAALFSSRHVYYSLVSSLFALCVGESQWELISWLANSLLVYKILSFSSCCLLCLLPASCWFLTWLTLRPWRWRQYVPPKRWLTFIGLHGVISQEIRVVLSIATAVRTSNLTQWITSTCNFTARNWCVE